MKERISFLEEKLKQTEQENALLIQQKPLVIEEFKKSKAFEDGINRVGAKGYKLGFEYCINGIKKLYPDLDLSSISIDYSAEKEEGKPTNDPIMLPIKETSERAE